MITPLLPPPQPASRTLTLVMLVVATLMILAALYVQGYLTWL